jgi:hypothetical protein
MAAELTAGRSEKLARSAPTKVPICVPVLVATGGGGGVSRVVVVIVVEVAE